MTIRNNILSLMPHELSVQSGSGAVSCFGGFFDSLEISEVLSLAVDRDAGVVASSIQGNTLDAGVAVCSWARVEPLLTLRGQTEVVDPIVQRVSVDVVDSLSGVGSMGHKPREAMRHPDMTRQSDDPTNMAAGTGARSRWFPREFAIPLPMAPVVSEMRSGPLSPREDASVGIVIQALANETDLGQFVNSHRGLPEGAWSGMSPASNGRRRSVSTMEHAHG